MSTPTPAQRSTTDGTVGNTNLMAILSLVFAFVFAPVGIVFGAIAKKQIARNGGEGIVLAKWGFWLSVVFTAFWVLYVVLVVVAAVLSSSNT